MKNDDRLIPVRPAGIRKKSKAPYWRGDRCEQIVAERIANYPVKKSRASSSRSGARKPRSPHAQLRRLERALARRKTLAARQRIQQQITALRKELGE